MEFVDPIRDSDVIDSIKQVLRLQSQRDLLLFTLGINTGLRTSELLSLKVEDVWDGEKTTEFLFIRDVKSGEERAFYLNSKVQTEIEKYMSLSSVREGDYLFKSKKGNFPITRQQAYRIINNAAKEVGLTGKIGTNTLRKTFGYHAYRKGVAISILMKIFHQHSSAETLKFIGIDKHENQLIKVDVNL